MSTYCEPASARTDWETPKWLFDALAAEFPITLDVCATAENAKCPSYFSVDSLSKQWTGMCWMNPPYGKEIGLWVKKAYDSAACGDAAVVCLLPARSSNAWWRYVIEGDVRFLRGRVKFVGAPSVTMFPNVIVVFHRFLTPGRIMSIWERPRVLSPDHQ